MNDTPTVAPPKKRRARKSRKDAAIPEAPSGVEQTACVEQAACQEGAEIIALPAEPKKRVRRPRKRKPAVEAPADMISPDEPIVSGQAIPLAVPVGRPFPSSPPRPPRPAALTPQIVSLRASMLVPIQHDAAPAMPSPSRFADFLSDSGRALSQAANVLRRHPRSTGLAMTAILLGISMTTAIVLSDPPESGTAIPMAEAPKFAAAPVVPAVSEVAASPVEESDPLAGIRIVDPSWDKKISCDEGTWPYIDQRCLTKDTSKDDGKVERKIGPRMIDSRTRPQAPEPTGPVGSTTAIVPAAPKVSVTDGVAPRDTELDAAGEALDQNVPEPPADTAPARIVETRTSTIRTYSAPTRSYASSPRYRPVRTFRLSEEAKPVTPPRRVVSTKKRQPTVAETGRRTQRRVVNNAAAPQVPQFVFPFGWFVQAR